MKKHYYFYCYEGMSIDGKAYEDEDLAEANAVFFILSNPQLKEKAIQTLREQLYYHFPKEEDDLRLAYLLGKQFGAVAENIGLIYNEIKADKSDITVSAWISEDGELLNEQSGDNSVVADYLWYHCGDRILDSYDYDEEKNLEEYINDFLYELAEKYGYYNETLTIVK